MQNIYKSQGQQLNLYDVVKVEHSYGSVFYIVAYSSPITAFMLYPLSGHSIPVQQIWMLDDVEWEYLGNIGDVECYSQLKIEGGLALYLQEMNQKLSLKD